MLPKYTEDDLFEHLVKMPFEKLKDRLCEYDRKPFIIDPILFRRQVIKRYHGVITGAGWTVEEFEFELNNIL